MISPPSATGCGYSDSHEVFSFRPLFSFLRFCMRQKLFTSGCHQPQCQCCFAARCLSALYEAALAELSAMAPNLETRSGCPSRRRVLPYLPTLATCGKQSCRYRKLATPLHLDIRHWDSSTGYTRTAHHGSLKLGRLGETATHLGIGISGLR